MIVRVEEELFSAALGLVAPWRVARSEFDGEAGRLDLFMDFPRGSRFACPEPGCAERDCVVHDTEDKTWRHLDFFQYQAYLHARVRRVRCPQHGVRQVRVGWARPGSGFTLLFEALLITFAAAMPVAKVAAFTGEQDTRIWRVLEHYVTRERANLDFSTVERVGVDETAAARGQDYVIASSWTPIRAASCSQRPAVTPPRSRLSPRTSRRTAATRKSSATSPAT
jgi:transposase